VDVVLLERATFPRSKPCAEYLSPEATRVLDRLGLLPRIDAFGPARLTGMRIVGPSGNDFVGHFLGEHGFRHWNVRAGVPMMSGGARSGSCGQSSGVY